MSVGRFWLGGGFPPRRLGDAFELSVEDEARINRALWPTEYRLYPEKKSGVALRTSESGGSQ